MSIGEKIRKRLLILRSFFSQNQAAVDVGLSEVIASSFQIYGLKKYLLRNKIHKELVGDLWRFIIDGRAVFWPGAADTDRLVDMYFEVYCENAHRFDRYPTPIEKGDIVIDVGCCEGFFSLMAVEKGAKEVYCFEPGRSAIRALERTFEHEVKSGRIEIVGRLLGEVSGELLFREDPNDPSIGSVLPLSSALDSHCYQVPVTTLDKFAFEKELMRVDFLKVDVEGYELEVLRGGAEMIKKHRPKIAIATYHRPDHFVAIRKFLSDIDSGYKFKLKGLVEFDGIVRPVLLHCYI